MSKEAIGLAEALAIHTELIRASGGSDGVRDQGGLEAALARPFMTFDRTELYPEPVDKAAAVLSALEHNPLTLAGLVTATGLARPTAHRLAVALEHHRFVGRDLHPVQEGCPSPGSHATDHA